MLSNDKSLINNKVVALRKSAINSKCIDLNIGSFSIINLIISDIVSIIGSANSGSKSSFKLSAGFICIFNLSIAFEIVIFLTCFNRASSDTGILNNSKIDFEGFLR